MNNQNIDGTPMSHSLTPRMKKVSVEPSVYALILESSKGSILHLGMHYSLDEAIMAATPRLTQISPMKKGEGAHVSMWASISGKQIMNQILSPEGVESMRKMLATNSLEGTMVFGPVVPVKKTLRDQADEIRKAKNELMVGLISGRDISALEYSREILSEPEHMLVKEKIHASRKGKRGAKK